ncbi:MAG: class I poly(R)-hydroxyalkanoic acid synthase [Hyphomicrobium sp.]|uniref:PHA/PHB synthase family protein n=1 Tax=Hyphomicrobium sp. TaxID=82 RepID=UPI0013230539|nr:class I poly(R)-hydroxyalkanoic acid synthase [Hyphomicrobium sp.]KAB2941994.1 MAG: class I poly(R)-hydroxyalkanoic acid synthase [Hyphomicrobium sp.]MBZ0211312.1 class I poly(R)-hydroxyalkanoic acid synthase [Hyphomicrobium sp.]
MPKPIHEIETDLLPYQSVNAEELARNLLRLFEQGGNVLTEFIERNDAKLGPYSAATEVTEATNTLTDLARQWLADPARFAEAQGTLLRSYAELWNNTVRRMFGEDVEPVAEPEPGDSRFKDPEWSANPYFDFWKQAYLVTARWAEDMLHNTSGLDDRTRQRAEFYLRQVASALSPSNFPFTNPEVLRETLSTNAENLVQGMSLLAEDMKKSGDLLKISQTDVAAFEVGRNLATTPGKIVYQNDIFQLIQYTSTTDKVRELPLLIVPPWINKYYILDLTPAKSLIKFLVDQGLTVFVISWVNPDASLSHKSFEDYMQEGILTAADEVKRETGVDKVNVVGYCVGGTLLATTLAYLAARGEEVFNSASFLATQIDFQYAGDLLLFTDADQLEALNTLMSERGYLDGSRMANVFNMLRPRDLIWPYIVNNYLLGKKPFPFDLLYWNQDSTRMAAANHNYYLREFYNENRLAKGELTLAGARLDMHKVKIPVFELATKEDHIAPARSVYTGAQLFGGEVEFVLSGSGHIAGVVNPPDKVKYQYWTSGKRAKTLEQWLATAKEHPGSWWPHWAEWLHELSGEWTLPREPGEGLGVIEDAPGAYVKMKS